jgi:hypothetical protein
MIARHDGYKLPFVCVRRNNQITAGAEERRAIKQFCAWISPARAAQFIIALHNEAKTQFAHQDAESGRTRRRGQD